MKSRVGTHQEQELERLRVENASLALENSKLARAINDPTRDNRIKELEKMVRRQDIALVSLTPLGSEFANEPENCVKHVREELDSLRELLKTAILRAREAEEEVDRLQVENKQIDEDNLAMIGEVSRLRARIRQLEGERR